MNGPRKPVAGMLERLFKPSSSTAGERAAQTKGARLDRRSMMFSLLSIAATPILCREFSPSSLGQQPKAAQPSGVMTGDYPPVYDARHRPVTAGGFVDGAPAVYQDCTRQ